MESSDLNASPEIDRRLEARLRQAQPVLPDDGFSLRVLAALPPGKRARPAPTRLIACVVASVAGVLFAAGKIGSPSELAVAAEQLNDSMTEASLLLTNPWFLVALAITGASLLVAFLPGSRRTFA